MNGINLIKIKDIYNPKIIDEKWIVGNKSCEYKKIKLLQIFTKYWIAIGGLAIPLSISQSLDKIYNFKLSLDILIYIALVFLFDYISLAIFSMIYNYYSDNN